MLNQINIFCKELMPVERNKFPQRQKYEKSSSGQIFFFNFQITLITYTFNVKF